MTGSISRCAWALVLAGGDGRRLRQLTRQIAGSPIPKQYCRIMGDRSMLEVTLARTRSYVSPGRTLVVVNHDHLGIGCEQLSTLPQQNILVQPANRDTGPGLLFALFHLARRDPNAIVGVFPSDHYVGNDQTFIAHVVDATRIVARLPDKVAILGIHPDRIEPAYGHVVPEGPLRPSPALAPAFHVAAFHEKPTADVASSLLSRGGLWNSFVMAFRVTPMLQLIRELLPNDFRRMAALAEAKSLPDAYRDLRPWNFSTEFLVRAAAHLVVLRVDDVQWSDWGTRESIERTLETLKQTLPWQARRPAALAAA